jgi:hypothetical protein
VDGNKDCVALQDKGALELPGHSTACLVPRPPIACATSSAGASTPACPHLLRVLTPTISGLRLSPSSFFAAPSGATTSKAKKAKKAYGTTIAYNDSQRASTTFTVLAPASGRTQGKACRKSSRANRHGRRCTILHKLGTFTHADLRGANKLHFSGRIKGKTLAKGSYRLQAVPRDAAGSGPVVSKEFKIKG